MFQLKSIIHSFAHVRKSIKTDFSIFFIAIAPPDASECCEYVRSGKEKENLIFDR